MSEWKEVKLGEITTRIGDGLHGTPKYDENGDVFFVNGNNLIQGKIRIKKGTKKVNREEAEKHKKPLSESSILLSINGTIGNLALYRNEICMLGKSACYININDKTDTKFMYYHFLNREFQGFLEVIATGTTILNVPLKGLRDYRFKLPPLPEQRTIASVLTSLDDKIDLLHRQNKTLEAMAETLFREWFVEEAKEDWEKGVLGDIVVFNYGKTLKKQERTGSGFPVYGSSGIVGYHEKFYVQGPGIITGRKGTLGVINYSFDNFYPIDTTFYITSKRESQGLYFEYCLLKKINLGEMNSDSAVPGLNRNNAHSIEIKIPPKKLVEDFNNIIKSYFLKILNNQIQICTLESLRDTLLPKLMNGTAQVSEL